MKKISLIILLFAISSIAFSQNMEGMDMGKKAAKPASSVIYTCTMHPEIQSKKPGNCPKCGMKLVVQKPKAAVKPKVSTPKTSVTAEKKGSVKSIRPTSKTPVIYTCTMHPEIHSAKPGNCPKCGMKLVVQKAKPASSTKPSAAKQVVKSDKMEGMNMSGMKTTGKKSVSQTIYTCVMHPEIHSAKPGNCPKCGMKLVVQKTEEKSAISSTAATDKMGDMDMGGNLSAQHDATQPATYTCVMHPEIHSNKPGNCPKCGMKLVKEKPKAAALTNHDGMQMPMKEGSGKMEDMSGMNMPANTMMSKVTYTCVMHPEIHSDKPGNCPKCGMKLVKEKSKTGSAMNPDGMQMPMKEGMSGMNMDSGMDMSDYAKAKKNLGPIKTIASKISPRTVRYDLYIADTTVTFGGKPKRAIAVNGQIPMPTLTFTEGDTAEIYVHNKLKEETSLHWHGLFLPNKMDGVPFVTQMPIKPGATYLYKFPIVQHGTHWYHSHSGLQEQIGMYGSFVMNKREEWDIPTIPVVF